MPRSCGCAPSQLFEPLGLLNPLIDWHTFPFTDEEEDALRQYD
jgi:hypothetical protein